MFLSRLFGASARPRSGSQRVRLEFDVFEERAVLSPIWGPFMPGQATQLLVIARRQRSRARHFTWRSRPSTPAIAWPPATSAP